MMITRIIILILYLFADSWAANGMLRSVIRPDKREVAFEYDALGRRIAKTFDGQVTRFVWDGNNPLHEWSYPTQERPQKVTDEFGFVTNVGTEPTENITIWIFEEGTFRPTAKITNEEKFSIVTDYLGTPAEMYDKFGIKVWSCELDIYGKVRKFEGNKYAPEPTSCPFRYQG